VVGVWNGAWNGVWSGAWKRGAYTAVCVGQVLKGGRNSMSGGTLPSFKRKGKAGDERFLEMELKVPPLLHRAEGAPPTPPLGV
jgi:hypothetical protein